MLFVEDDTELLKAWLIKKLETVADADSDVLADYVLALVKTDDSEAVAKANCTEQLKDFLLDDVDRFVEELFKVIATKSYDPSKPPPKAAPIYKPPQRASHELPAQVKQGRKRGYHDWDRDESQSGTYEGGGRPMKQAKRGGRGGKQQHNYGSLPKIPPPGMPPFDPNNPMAAFMAVGQALGMIPGFPPTDGTAPRCIDYDAKGYCSRGASCPYEHGNDAYVLPDDQEYDPNQPMLLNVRPSRTGTVNRSPGRARRGQRGRGGNNNSRGGKKRSEVSHLGPNNDPSNTTIVVEQIPEENFGEHSVYEFFQQFGNIEEVTLRPRHRIAIIKYDDYESANSAYNSPKVVFDNRFVKVYWHKSDDPKLLNGRADWAGAAGDEEMQDQEPETDLGEVAKKQEEAQRKHEERKKKTEEALNRQKAIDELETNRKRALAEIAKKTNKNAPSEAGPLGQENEKTKGLREQLAKLEAEALQMGIDPNAVDSNSFNGSPYSYRGRGGYRGRPRGRGGYNPSFRGGYGALRGGAVMRLDNRPKTVCVTFNEGTYEEHQEALRQLLFFNGSEATLTKHPDRQDAALVAFQERYLGDNFMVAASAPDFSLAGKCELSWHTPSVTIKNNAADPEKMVITSDDHSDREASPGREMDDVADEDDRWG